MKTVEITYRYEARETPARPRPSDSDAALLRLDDGNRAFAALLDGLTDDDSPARRIVPVDPRDLGLLAGDAGAARQRPFAAILGCADARVPVELIFNEGGFGGGAHMGGGFGGGHFAGRGPALGRGLAGQHAEVRGHVGRGHLHRGRRFGFGGGYDDWCYEYPYYTPNCYLYGY